MRQSKNLDENDSKVPCPHCFGFFKATKLHRHISERCPAYSEEKVTKPLSSGRALLCVELCGGKFEEVHRHIIFKMVKRDEVFLVLRNDDTLLLYAATQMQTKEEDRYNDILFNL